MIDRRSLLAAALAGAALPARAAAGDTLRIGYQKNGILVVAKQQGVIEARLKALGVGVTWVEFSFGPPLLEAISLGAIDLGQTGDAPPIFAQAAGSPLVYVAAQEAAGSGAAVLVQKESPIRSLADLRAKRVAFAKASSAHNLTIAALEKAGLTYRDIEPVTLAPADAAAAFARGSVDAWTIWDPYFAIAEMQPSTRVLSLATDIAKPNNFFLAHKTVAAERGPVLDAALDALSGVARWCEANRGEVAALLSKGTGVPLAATRRAVDRTDYVIGPMTPSVVAEQQRVADRFHALSLIPHPIRIGDALRAPVPQNG
ncbi:aliphatic sulfonate ABC transporter substrate-binding protein [Methylobacterium currus]|uniref:Putative aliphatic sulfonates-binding protein n=1 Tax=Methylobacterium currus TaxID=2051553 RepID=A0A2R4WDY3_9HYPH|nr:aliphatic sulfonate ABC transporter substrate-binding protein [Methylobacterium currus]AWB19752.1 aliphatic sulfonate ABC transporter substrate-binding protein [Methylobacterium currus]UHC15536.1 aliphatic sulfonate ABC transporter substrate-binding protein [Methylobacterium currus]